MSKMRQAFGPAMNESITGVRLAQRRYDHERTLEVSLAQDIRAAYPELSWGQCLARASERVAQGKL